MPGCFASTGDPLNQVQFAVLRPDRENDQRVFAAVARIQEKPVRRDSEFGGSIFVAGKVGRYGFDRRVCIDQKPLGGITETRGSPKVVIKCRVDLVDAVDPAAVGMKCNVAGT